MTDKAPDSSEKKLPETPDTDNEDFVFPGDENIAIPLKFNPDEYDIPEDDETPMEYERSQIPKTPETPETDDDLGEEEEEEDEDVETKSPGPADIDPSLYEDDEDVDEDGEESEDDDNLKKLEKDIDNDKLIESHPEIIQNNYNEILALCTLVRNDKGEIVDDLHKTYPFLTKYEYARIIGIRAKQINNGADPFIKVARGTIDGFTIAKLEMDAKKVPFIIARPLPNGSREYWKVQDLEMIHF